MSPIYGIGEGFSLIAVMREDFNPGVVRLVRGHFNVLSQPRTLYFLATTY